MNFPYLLEDPEQREESEPSCSPQGEVTVEPRQGLTQRLEMQEIFNRLSRAPVQNPSASSSDMPELYADELAAPDPPPARPFCRTRRKFTVEPTLAPLMKSKRQAALEKNRPEDKVASKEQVPSGASTSTFLNIDGSNNLDSPPKSSPLDGKDLRARHTRASRSLVRPQRVDDDPARLFDDDVVVDEPNSDDMWAQLERYDDGAEQAQEEAEVENAAERSLSHEDGYDREDNEGEESEGDIVVVKNRGRGAVLDVSDDEDALEPQGYFSPVDRISYRSSQPCTSSQRSRASIASQSRSRTETKAEIACETARTSSFVPWVPTQCSSFQVHSNATSQGVLASAQGASRSTLLPPGSSGMSSVGVSVAPTGSRLVSQPTTPVVTAGPQPSTRPMVRMSGFPPYSNKPTQNKSPLKQPSLQAKLESRGAIYNTGTRSSGPATTSSAPASGNDMGQAVSGRRDQEHDRSKSLQGTKIQDDRHQHTETVTAASAHGEDSDPDIAAPGADADSSYDCFSEFDQEDLDRAMLGY